MKESERKIPTNHSANPLTIVRGATYKSSAQSDPMWPDIRLGHFYYVA